MHQKDIERFAFLYLCGTKDKHMLLEKERMTFSNFERLAYLTDFLGPTDYNLDIWGKFAEQFKNQFNVLIEMYEDVDMNSYEGLDIREYDEGSKLYDIWVRKFCRHAPNKELRLWLEEQAVEIYEDQGLEPFGQEDFH